MELFFLRHLIHNKRSSETQQGITFKVLFRNVTLVVSKTDSLMVDEQMDLVQNRMTADSFNKQFALRRREFQGVLKCKVEQKLNGTDLSKLGKRRFVFNQS